MRLEDAKMIVTGGASGMGRCFTIELARAGADVVFCDINADGIAAVEAEAEGLAGTVKGMVANVADEDSMQQLIANAADHMGGLNGIINNAGIIRDGKLVGKDRKTGGLKPLSMKKWQQVIDVNLTGVFLGSRAFAEYHIANNNGQEGVIVSISSISRHGNFGQSNYSAAKSGIVAMTTVWSKELAKNGIRAGAVAPGATRTPILEQMPPEILQKLIVDPIPLGRIAEPTEIFMAVKFIIECGYYTGQCIDVDGGFSF